MAVIEYFSGVLVATSLITFIDVALTLPYRNGGISPVRILIAALLPLLICKRARRNRNLTTGGSFVAYFMGVALILSSYTYMAMMLMFFITSSRLTKFRANKKFQKEHDEFIVDDANTDISCHRDSSLISLIDYGFGTERPIDFSRDYSGSWYDLAILGALSCATGDTWSSELGSVIGTGDPILITSLQSVPRGTNGGVSLAGTVASIFGGLCVGLTHWICIYLWSNSDLFAVSRGQCLVVLLGACSGFIGSIIDSFLGATLQYSGLDRRRKIVVDKPSDNVDYICGCDYLGNNAVNFLSCLMCAFLTPTVGFALWAKYGDS